MRKLTPADEARRILLETPPVGAERVPLAAAGGRVLAEAVSAAGDLPAERRAVMDGYAVRAADVQTASESAPAVLRVVGTVPMGDVFGGQVGGGEAVVISTGGFVPEGADAVVMVETTSAVDGGGGDDRVEIRKAVARGANVIQPGEDLRRGDPLLAAGRRLRPQDLAVLAMFGAAEVPVFRRPRIAVVSTGNELCEPGETPRPGQVRDANQVALAAQIARAGCDVTHGGIVRDDLGALRASVQGLLATHDGVIISGGSSVGIKDLSGQAFADLPPPGVLFHGIDIRPGKPTLFARAGGKPVVGMPGFPTSALIVFDAFIRPMLLALGGEAAADPWPSRRRARLAKDQPSVPGREDYLRVKLVQRSGTVWAEPLPGGSASLSNVLYADGLVKVEAARDKMAAGEEVEVLLY